MAERKKKEPQGPWCRAATCEWRRARRLVADPVRGLTVPEARTLLDFSGRAPRAHREAGSPRRRRRGQRSPAGGRGHADRGDPGRRGADAEALADYVPRGRKARIKKRNRPCERRALNTRPRIGEGDDGEREDAVRGPGESTRSTTGSRHGSTSANSRTTCLRASQSASTSSAAALRTPDSPRSESSRAAPQGPRQHPHPTATGIVDERIEISTEQPAPSPSLKLRTTRR